MAAKSRHSQHVMDEAVKRKLAGESVAVLSKYYGISRAGFYLWEKKYKQSALKVFSRAGMSPSSIKESDTQDLKIKLGEALREIARLREKLFNLMLKHNEV